MTMIYPSDLACIQYAGKTGFCAKGCRRWAAAHGFDWAQFVREGISAERLAATGDPMALAAIAAVTARREGEEDGQR
jgi:hypothetical protein